MHHHIHYKKLNEIIFINADDFGCNTISNERISHCINQNLISSATIIANMPAFDDAVQYFHKYKYNGRVGFHINLADGYPLSEQMRIFLKGEDLKALRLHFSKHIYSKEEQNAIYHEIKAQLQKLYDNGIIPTHIDTHGHMHKFIGILNIIMQVAKENRITYIRRCRNIYTNIDVKNIILKKCYNLYFNLNSIVSSKYFTSLEAYVTNNCKLLNAELMCHPGDDKEFAFLCSDQYRKFLHERKSHVSFEPFSSNGFK